MYQRFKNCILKPRNIADYIKEPKKTTVLYTIILLIIYVIPFILITLLSKSAVTTLSTSVSEDLINAEQINYVIEEGKLKAVNNQTEPQYIKTDLIIDSYKFNSLYVFDISGESYESILKVENGAYIVFLFTETEFKITQINVSNENTNNDNSGVVVNLNKNSVDKNNLEFVSLSYEELGIKNFDLSSNKKSNTINFRNEVSLFVESIYDELKMKLLPIIIIVIMIIVVGSYFFSVIFITLLFKLLYRYLQIDFGTVFKAVILSSTPYVICSLLAIVLGINLLEIIGQFIMIAYATKALTTYKIKYDGGMPLPGYMRNMMNDKKDDEEKGSGDDEL